MACQTYNSIPRQVRQGLTNLFIFKVNKTEISNIFNEQVEIFRDKFEEVLDRIYNMIIYLLILTRNDYFTIGMSYC